MTQTMTSAVQMVARYPGRCAACRGAVSVGASILWDRATKAVQHVTCGAAPVAPRNEIRVGSYATIGARTSARMARTGWTGCSCGSIEGQPRRSDCSTCQFDY